MERAEKIIVDASVAIKWFNVEEYTDNALAIRDDYVAGKVHLITPYLIAYEVGNALRYNPDFGVEDVKFALKDLLDMQMDLRFLDKTQCEIATELAFNYAITIYDAAYLALTIIEKALLYTADDRLLTKVKLDEVKHIKDYGKK